MSVLHEALRKAERAREEAAHAPKRAELSAVPLEIVAEPATPGTSTPFALEAEPQPEARPPAEANPAADEELAAPNPQRAFHLALGLAAIVAIAGAAYLWSQLRPAPAATKPLAPHAFVAQPAPKPAAEPPAPPSNAALLAGLPPVASPSAPPAEPPAQAAPQAAAPPPTRPATAAKPAAKEPAALAAALPAKPPAARAAVATIHPRVQAGYSAYQAGDLALARAEYEQALRADAGNRDALLGIAAVEARAGRTTEAENAYRRLLQADPRDADAHAGLLALRAGRVDPLQAESRVKSLLANEPEAGALHFTLGNQYARQGRWDEAQLAYARAHAADPANPDFAFNHAVSLDHLRQRGAALGQYRLALELAGTRTAHFPLDGARERIAQLAR